jgi:hypothetical protein
MPKKVELPHLPGAFGRQRTRQDQEFILYEFVVTPLLDQVEQLLNIKAIYNEVKNPKQSTPGTYSSYRDGKLFKSNPLFQVHLNSLQIHFYIDEVQLCNPVGSYTP